MIQATGFLALQSPARDQGSRCSCVGFAVAAAHESMRSGTLCSVEDALWAAHQIAGDPAREATSVEYALRGLQLHRHAEDAAWPYGAPAFPAARPLDALDRARQVDLVVWRRMTTVDPAAVATEVASGRAVVLTLGVVVGAWSSSGDVDAPAGRRTPGAHAVLVVGNPVTAAQNRTLIKNSWGAQWGINGYGFISDRYLAHYTRVGHVLEPSL